MVIGRKRALPSISEITIRTEVAGDAPVLRDLTERAFAPMAYSDGKEGAALDQLRRDGDLVLSLVAAQGDQIVGHVAFSPVMIGGETGWIGLGPVSVDPTVQKQRIGTRLIRQGLDHLRNDGAKGVVLIGDPAYYSRFGFATADGLTYGEVPAQYVQYLSFSGAAPCGAIRFSTGLENAG